MDDEVEVSLDRLFSFDSLVLNNFVDEVRCDQLRREAANLATEAGGLSFWLGASSKPRTTLERFGRAVWDLHMASRAHLQVDAVRSGVEYWVQQRTSRQPRSHRGVNWHFDKDEDLLDSHDIFIHPSISTVTYLTSEGAPTVILPVTVDYEGTPTVGKGIALVSTPLAGRHLAFDGTLLHGCPPDLETSPRWSFTRLTLLVNIWVNHVPVGVRRWPFPTSTRGAHDPHPMVGARRSPHVRHAVHGGDACRSDRARWRFPVGRGHEMSVAFPHRSLHRALRSGSPAVDVVVECDITSSRTVVDASE